MTWLIYLGAIVTLLGLAGLAYCIWKANGLRTSGLIGDDMTAAARMRPTAESGLGPARPPVRATRRIRGTSGQKPRSGACLAMKSTKCKLQRQLGLARRTMVDGILRIFESRMEL